MIGLINWQIGKRENASFFVAQIHGVTFFYYLMFIIVKFIIYILLSLLMVLFIGLGGRLVVVCFLVAYSRLQRLTILFFIERVKNGSKKTTILKRVKK